MAFGPACLVFPIHRLSLGDTSHFIFLLFSHRSCWFCKVHALLRSYYRGHVAHVTLNHPWLSVTFPWHVLPERKALRNEFVRAFYLFVCIYMCVPQQCAISAPCSKTKGNKETKQREAHRRGKIARGRERQEDRFHYLRRTEELNHAHATERSYSQRLDPVRWGICDAQTAPHCAEIYTARSRNSPLHVRGLIQTRLNHMRRESCAWK